MSRSMMTITISGMRNSKAANAQHGHVDKMMQAYPRNRRSFQWAFRDQSLRVDGPESMECLISLVYALAGWRRSIHSGPRWDPANGHAAQSRRADAAWPPSKQPPPGASSLGALVCGLLSLRLHEVLLRLQALTSARKTVG
eukprot:2808727-Rhodomonas_salina.5